MSKERFFKSGNLTKNGIKLCFISCFPPSRGRLAEYSYHLISELEKLSEIDRIDILANADDTNLGEINNFSKKVKVHRVWTSKNPLSTMFILTKLFKLNPDVVHFNLHFAIFGRSRIANFLGLSLPFISSLMGFKVLTTLHNIIERIDIQKTDFQNTFLNRLGSLFATKLLTMGNTLVVTMKSYIKILKKRFKCKNLVWIPHGTWNVDPGAKKVHNPQSILYFGHSGPYKDLDLLFDAFKILNNRKSAIKLIVAGESHPNYPTYLNMYKARNEKSNIQFTGYIPEEEFSEFFKYIDVIVLPYSTCTGTSGIVHLACSYGIPIIATDLPEFHELIEEGCGILLSPHNSFALAEKIEHALENQALMLVLRKKNLNFAKGRLWEKIAISFYELYKKQINA